MGLLDAPAYSRSQADTRFATKNLITVDELFADAAAAGKPVIFPHRGAGALVAPENTLEAFRLGASYGFGCIDGGDLWALAGGATDLAVNHDATVDYMTTGTGNISDFTPMSYRNLPVDAGGPNGWFGGTWGQDPTVTGGFRSLRSVTFDDILREFGGRIVLSPEVKGTNGTNILRDQILRYGLQASVLPGHFSLSQLSQYVAIGCDAIWLSTSGTNSTKNDVAAAGVRYVCFDAAVSDSVFTDWISDGRFVVGVYTINRQYQRDHFDALGCKFYYSDSPVYLSKDTSLYHTTRDTFAGGDYFHGHQSNFEGTGNVGPGARGYFQSGGWLTFPSVASAALGTGTERSAYLGYMAPFASASYTLDLDMRWDTLPTDTTRYGGVVFSCPDDRPFYRLGTDYGFSLIYRANGFMQLEYRDGSGTVVQSSAVSRGAITVAGTIIHLRVVVTPTTISAYRTDAGTTSSAALVFTNSGTRGLFGPHLTRTDTATTGPMVLSYRNVIVT